MAFCDHNNCRVFEPGIDVCQTPTGNWYCEKHRGDDEYSRKKTPWAYFNGETNDFTCERCNTLVHVELPMEVRAFARESFKFADAHEECEESK